METAKFYKVSYEQFEGAMLDDFDLTKEQVKEIYDNLKLPKRATKGSAGYDFYTPVDIHLEPGKTMKIPTGIRCEMNERWVLMIYPRSGLATKMGLRPANCVGVIDPDYRGEIIVAIHNDTDETQSINPGDRIAQFILTEKFLCEWREVDELNETDRGEGGFGSTGK
jgi:dUTP pyrophosphatase